MTSPNSSLMMSPANSQFSHNPTLTTCTMSTSSLTHVIAQYSVSYCKHLAAISLHYYYKPKNQPLENLWAHTGTPPNTKPSCVPILKAPLMQTAERWEELAILALIPEKFQRLTVHIQLAPPQQLTSTLQKLDSLLDHFMAEYAQPQVLPMLKKITPN